MKPHCIIQLLQKRGIWLLSCLCCQRAGSQITPGRKSEIGGVQQGTSASASQVRGKYLTASFGTCINSKTSGKAVGSPCLHRGNLFYVCSFRGMKLRVSPDLQGRLTGHSAWRCGLWLSRTLTVLKGRLKDEVLNTQFLAQKRSLL